MSAVHHRRSNAAPIKSLALSALLLISVQLSFGSDTWVKSLPQVSTTPVVMLSLDGFRHDYLQRGHSPNLERFARLGLASDGLIPAFPTSTFTNHYSIVTGLYPGNHGIIGNTFYDRTRAATYRMTNRKAVEDGRWYFGEPLWVAVEKSGGIAASFFWVGSEADIQGTRPTHYKRYDGRIANTLRVEQVLDWLQLPPDERPSLITLYFSDVDSAGHNFGPDSAEVNEAITKVDNELGALLVGLAALPFGVNLIITSDHGMSAVNEAAVKYLEDWIDLSLWTNDSKIINGGAFTYFYSKNSNLLVSSINHLKNIPGLEVFSKGNFPAQMHLGENARTPDFIVTVDAPAYLMIRRPKRSFDPPAGAHGYMTASNADMHGVFYAAGPGIKPGNKPAFENIHVYPFVMSLMGLNITTPIDGDLAVLAEHLRQSAMRVSRQQEPR